MLQNYEVKLLTHFENHGIILVERGGRHKLYYMSNIWQAGQAGHLTSCKLERRSWI